MFTVNICETVTMKLWNTLQRIITVSNNLDCFL